MRAGGAVTRLLAYLELTKPGIAAVVLMTASAGYLVAVESPDWELFRLMLLGTALSAAGAGALNMLLERGPDSLMLRTRERPLPSGRIRPLEALLLGLSSAVAGVLVLAKINAWAAGAAAVCLAVYLACYTPLKRRTAWCIIPGALSGAMPPLIGWAAAHGGLGSGAIPLFLILFLWQFPHIVGLGRMYQDDYQRAGFRMIPSGPEGDPNSWRLAVAAATLLVPVSLLPFWLGWSGNLYAAGALLLGGLYAGASLHFARRPGLPAARLLFFTSIGYMPLLLSLLIIR